MESSILVAQAPIASRLAFSPRPASPSRRAFASMIDVMFGVLAAFFMLLAMSPFLALDQALSLGWAIGLSTVVGLFAPLFSLLSTGTTLGKAICGLRIVGVDGQPLSRGRMTVRSVLLTLLWPLNALMLVLRAKGRHLADVAAKTQVLQVRSRNRWLALALGAAAMTASFCASIPTLKLAAHQTTVARLARKAAGAGDGLALSMRIDGSRALIYLATPEGQKRVSLVRRAGVWSVVEVTDAAPGDVPNGVSLSLGQDAAFQAKLESSMATMLGKQEGVGTVRVSCPAEGLLGEVTCQASFRDGSQVHVRVNVPDKGEAKLVSELGVGSALAKGVDAHLERHYTKPERVECAPIFDLRQKVTCRASYDARPIELVVQPDRNVIGSISGPALHQARALELEGRRAWETGHSEALVVTCAERGYVLTPDREAVCDTSRADTVAAFRLVDGRLVVSFRGAD
jgi:uncharacterized RDD family membrane protein YckC